MISDIVGGYQTGDAIPPYWFPGDDLLSVILPRGLPIGNLTSQLWGNYYLDGLDHFITEQLEHGSYVRYTDDFLLFGNSKTRLWETRQKIVDQLGLIRLTLAEPKSRILKTSEGIPFLGFVFEPNLRPRILGETKRRFLRRMSFAIQRREFVGMSRSVSAFYAFASEGNTLGLRKSWAR